MDTVINYLIRAVQADAEGAREMLDVALRRVHGETVETRDAPGAFRIQRVVPLGGGYRASVVAGDGLYSSPRRKGETGTLADYSAFEMAIMRGPACAWVSGEDAREFSAEWAELTRYDDVAGYLPLETIERVLTEFRLAIALA